MLMTCAIVKQEEPYYILFVMKKHVRIPLRNFAWIYNIHYYIAVLFLVTSLLLLFQSMIGYQTLK